MDDRSRYYRQEAEEGTFLSAPYNQDALRWLYSSLPVEQISFIGDIGSGRGLNLPLLREMFPSARRVALDLNRAALQAAAGLNVCKGCVQADALSLPLRDGPFDLVVCTEVLEHVADLRRAVGEIYRVLGPHRYAVISSPNYFNPMGLRKWFSDRRLGQEYWDPWGGHPGFERLMLPWQVARTIKASFSVLRVCGAGFLMAWIPLGYRRIGKLNDKFPLMLLGRLPFLRNLAVNRYLLLQKV